MPPQPALTVEQLRTQIGDGDVDTVVVAFTDMQGRLQGKRLHAQFFLDEVLEHGTEGCNYLLAVDVDMNTVDGYAMQLVGARLRRLRVRARPRHAAPVPWLPGTAMVLCDLAWLDDGHSPVRRSRRGRSCAGSSTGPPSTGWSRLRRHRARVHRLQRHATSRPGTAATAT